MKKQYWLFLFAATILAAAPEQKQNQAPASQTRPAALTLPREAREIEANTYSYTDARGQRWIYRRTPFGLVRYPDQAEAAPPAAGTLERATPFGMVKVDARTAAAPVETPADIDRYLHVTDLGGQVRFERTSPFGVERWTRGKSELNDFERRAWERECERQRAAASASHPQQ